MNENLRLMAILAHPDDESLGLGGTLARYAAEGIEVSLVMATRGERGWHGDPAGNPGLETLGRIREGELRAAAAVLGIRRLTFLDEIDGVLDRCDRPAVVERLASEIRLARPDVVVTFGPDGGYGHPDHIAISELTTSAVLAAADPGFPTWLSLAPLRVRKLYQRVWTDSEAATLRSVFGPVSMMVDGSERSLMSWPDWAVSARLDTADYWWEAQTAVLCHRSQVGANATLAGLGPRDLRLLWSTQSFVRVLSTVMTGPGVEDDLFAGLRPSTSSRIEVIAVEAAQLRTELASAGVG